MVGAALMRKLLEAGYADLILADRSQLDLRDQNKVEKFIETNRPDVLIDAAATVGGIQANNTYPYNFLMDNLQIQNNLINGAFKYGVKKFLFLGSSCIYPKHADQPIQEESLLTGPLEPTNEAYAIAKIAGLKACQAIRRQYGKDFFSLMPTNLYGEGDNFDPETAHVLPAMIRKFHHGKVNGLASLTLWGSSSPKREFLHVNDFADGIRFCMEHPLEADWYNMGSGDELSIKSLAELIRKIVGFEGEIHWDTSKPDGTPRKLLDSSKINNLGWTPKISLEEGIRQTYAWFLQNEHNLKEVKF